MANWMHKEPGEKIGRLIFIHLRCWEVLPFLKIQRQRCIQFRVLRRGNFYAQLPLNCQKGGASQHLRCIKINLPKNNIKYLDLPSKQKSAWINFGFKKVKLERNADNSGREFWAWIFGGGGGAEILEKQGRKIRHQNSPSNFAEKFAGNFPKIRSTKI